jgi:ABC-type nitrate/sulfonate/bicarbonate transport system permease component
MATAGSLPVRPAQPVTRQRARARRLWAGWLAVPLVATGAWAVVAEVTDLVSPVGPTLSALADAFTEGWIGAPLANTSIAVFGGFAIAAVAGLLTGFALARVRILAAIFEPILTALFAVPRIILYPVLLAGFGVGIQAKLWMAAISAFFPIAITTTAGVRDVSATLIKLGRSLNCSRRQMVTKIYVPAAAPSLMTGLRIGFSIAFISVIIAELFASSDGLGRVLDRAYAFQQLPRMYAVVLLIVLIAFFVNLALWLIERRLRWGAE